VANDKNWPQIAAIEVCLPYNLAVVFDLMFFRFRPSKAKRIGNVLTNRQNTANYLQRFFLLEVPELEFLKNLWGLGTE
jgi:hypothetical protein